MNSYELTPDFFENLKNHSLKAESKKWGFRLKVHVREYAKTAFALTTSPQRTESNYIAYNSYRGGQSLIIFDKKHQEENEKMTELRIRKLTPLEYWRLMGFDDSDFWKVAYKKDIVYLEGGTEKCCANLKVVTERQRHIDTDTYVLCTISDLSDMEILKTIRKLLAEMPETEKTQNVDFVITKSADVAHLECATNIIKCFTFMGMQCTLMVEKDQQVMDIIALGEKDKRNTARSMRIITGLNSNPLKLYIILILIAQITRLKIYGSSTRQVNIQSAIAITENCENSILLKISGLKMETISTRISSSQLYRQAGNSIVVNVAEALFKELEQAELLELKNE